MEYIALAELPRWMPTLTLVGVGVAGIALIWMIASERTLVPFLAALVGIAVTAGGLIPMQAQTREHVADQAEAVAVQIATRYGVDVDPTALEYPSAPPSDPDVYGVAPATVHGSGESVAVMLFWDGERMLLQGVGAELPVRG